VTPLVSFETWKDLLYQDCIVHGKAEVFRSFGDGVLRVLYEGDLDPTVQAIATDNGEIKKSA
jgi:hypothetical protein